MDPAILTTLAVRNQFAREGVARILRDHDFEIAQAVATLDEIKWPDQQADHIVIFEGAPSFSADELAELERLIATHRRARVVLIIDEFDLDLVTRAFAAGIYGCMPTQAPVEAVVSIVRLVALGLKIIPQEMTEVMNACSVPSRNGASHDVAATYCLSVREVEILQCLMAGMPNKMISRSLGVSEAAVKLKVKAIFRKMAVTNRTQAAILAHERDGAFAHR